MKKKGLYWLYTEAKMFPVWSVFLSAVKGNIIRETSWSRFRDLIRKMRGGCVAVDSSICDFTTCGLEHSYTTVVETSVTNYQSTRCNVSEDLNIYLKKLFEASLQAKVMGLLYLGLSTKTSGLTAKM